MAATNAEETVEQLPIIKDEIMKRLPEKRNASRRQLTFIPDIFKVAAEGFPPFDKDDPFIRPEVLQDHLSFLATNSEGIPNFAANSPNVEDAINFSEQDWKDIEESQRKLEERKMKRQKEEAEAKELEEQKKKQKEADDSQIKQTLDRRVDLIFKKHYHFIKKTCPVMIPYKSILNHEEHKAYMRAFVKFKIRLPITAAENVEYQNYLSLQNRVYEEQQCFMRFAYQVARLQLKSYNYIPEVITNFINEYVRDRCRRVSHYRATYVHEQMIPLCPQDPTNRFGDLYFTHIGHLLSLGSVPWIKLPSRFTHCCLPVDDTVKERDSKLEPSEEGKYLYKTPVSQDPNAIFLAKQHLANVVVSTSALKVITDNPGPNFDKEWDIPVIVRSYDITDSDGKTKSHRVVFIDKPLPKKIWTPSEKKQRFFKKSALSSMTEIRRKSFFRMKCPLNFKIERVAPEVLDNAAEDKVAAEYSEDFLDLYSSTDHDVFGCSSPTRLSKHGAKGTKKNAKTANVETVPKKGEVGSGSSTIEGSQSETFNLGKDSDTPSKETNTCSPGIPPKRTKTGTQGAPPKRIKTGPPDTPPKEAKTVASSITPKEMETEPSSTPPKVIKADAFSTPPKETMPGASITQSKDASSVLDNLLDMQDTLLKPTTPSNSPLKQTQDNISPETTKKMWPWSDTLKTNWDEHMEAMNCKNWSGSNVHYQLFSMGFNNSKPFSTTQPTRVLVRSGLHGLSSFKGQLVQSKAFVVYPKPEYQAYFGCEVNTLSEITHQWLDLLVRPHASLLEVRVCQNSGDIMMSEVKTLSSILKEGKQQHINFSPQQPLSSMYAVFSSVSALPTGDYILQHNVKTEAFIKLMKAADPQNDMGLSTHDLHDAYSTASVYTRTHAKPPWIALDTHKLTAFHLKHYKIPGTFPMDNPNKKMTKRDKKKIKEKAQDKKRLSDLQADDP